MKIRHPIRILIIVAIGAMVLMNDYFCLKGQYGGQNIIDESWLYSTIEGWVGRSPHLHPYESFAHGSLWSMELWGFRISDPLAAISSPTVLWWTALLPLAAAMLLGRAFCGWLCPMGLLSEMVVWLRKLAAACGIQFFSLALTPKLKYVALAVGTACAVGLSVSFFHPIYPPRIISDVIRNLLTSNSATYGLALIGGILLAELLFVERLWCRCLCPGGAMYSLAGRARIVQIRRDAATCTDCKNCDAVCPHQLAPSHKSLGGECDNCGLCRSACEPRALSYRLTWLGKRRN